MGEVITLERAAVAAKHWRMTRGAVVQCQGCFDLLHPGHLAHFEAAREAAPSDDLDTLLIVCVTSDRYVNKGPGRPVFPAETRARMIAALQVVDYVCVVDFPGAMEAIEAIKPDFYVKGADYADMAKDVTRKILLEKEAVERHGGKIHFTENLETFSSSRLINSHMNDHAPAVRACLEDFRGRGAQSRIMDLLERARGLKVLVLGETIIDEYRYAEVLGKSSKEPTLSVISQSREDFAGGVIAAANHAAAVSDHVQVISLTSPDLHAERLIAGSLKESTNGRFEALSGATIYKRRYIEPGFMRKMFEVYRWNPEPMTPQSRDRFNDMVVEEARLADVVICCDFGHGFFDERLRTVLTHQAKFLAVNSQTNSGNHGFNPITRWVNGCPPSYVCLDLPEARLAIGDPNMIAEDAADKLADLMDVERLVVTAGRHGCALSQAGDMKPVGTDHIPAFGAKVVDTMGAGDAFFAVTAPLASIAKDLRDVAFVGNAAAALKVGVVGHRESTDRMALIRYVETLLK